MSSLQKRYRLTAAICIAGFVIFLAWMLRGRDRPPVFHTNPTWWYVDQRRLPYHPTRPPQITEDYDETFCLTNDCAQKKMLYAFADAAQLYNFNPQITYYRSNCVGPFKMVYLQTPTHSVEFRRGKIYKVESFFDSSDFQGKPEVIKQWYQCTGRWTEQAAIKGTLDILERLGETQTLAYVTAGKFEYEADEVTVRRPDGKKIRIAPFPVVKMFDAEGGLLVRAEYRMGTNGPVGLVDWFHL